MSGHKKGHGKQVPKGKRREASSDVEFINTGTDPEDEDDSSTEEEEVALSLTRSANPNSEADQNSLWDVSLFLSS